MFRFAPPLAALALVGSATAQLTHVIPNGMAGVLGSTANAFPWGMAGLPFGGLRILACYDSTNFTAASISGPIVILGLRWRASNTGSWTGGTFTSATVKLSTAAVDYTAVQPAWSPNHGADLTVCYTGPVTAQPGNAPGPGPGPFHVDVQLATPFVYDPAGGDLCIETDFASGSFVGGTLPLMEIDGRVPGTASRVFGSSLYPAANGTTQNHGIIVEVTYLPANGNVALHSSYGDGCYESSSTFYELFGLSTFDLSNTAIRLTPAGGGYDVTAIAASWFTPTSPAIASLGSTLVSPAQSLGFSMPFPGGSTQAVFISGHGFVWALANTQNGCCMPTPGALLLDGARWCPLWTRLTTVATGALHFDVDPANGAAYVTFDNVAEFGSASRSSFQVAFFDTGVVEYRYQNCAVSAHTTLVGWSPGSGVSDPGNVDLSAVLPIAARPDRTPLVLAAAGRPIVGTGVTMTASAIPNASPLGAFVGSFNQLNPGMSLAPLGMPGCEQFVALDATRIFLPTASTASFVFQVPNDAGLNGLHVYLQAAAMAVGQNPLGMLSSNGIDLEIGLN